MKTLDVLLVEDNAGDALLTGQTLAQSSLPVKLHIARDGEQAMMMLADPDFHPALIILDLNIPRVPGALLLERMPKRDIPVVVFSGSADDRMIAAAYDAGAISYIPKTGSARQLAETVAAIVRYWLDVNRVPESPPSAQQASA